MTIAVAGSKNLSRRSSGQVTGREIERLSRFNGSDGASGEVMADSDGEVDDGESESALRRIP